jgi:electron transport complex protein RnfC
MARQQAQHKSEQTKKLMDARTARLDKIARLQAEEERERLAAKAERERRLVAEAVAEAEENA